MELKTIEDTKNKLVIEIKGEDHTFSNYLRKELWNDSDVEVTGYIVEHPLIGIPKFTIETKKGNPKKVLLNALERLKKKNKALKEKFGKL